MENINNVSLISESKHVFNFGICYINPPSTDLLKIDTSITTHEYHFKPHKLTLEQFKNIFYNDEYGIYHINELYKDTEFINFSKQLIEDSDNTYNIFNINEYVISAYEDFLNVTRDKINSITLMNLNKELLKIKSLCDICHMEVHHTFKELEHIFSNYSKLNNSIQLNFKFIYKNDTFKDIEIVFNFYYDIDLE